MVGIKPLSGDFYRLDGCTGEQLEQYSCVLAEYPGVDVVRTMGKEALVVKFHLSMLSLVCDLIHNSDVRQHGTPAKDSGHGGRFVLPFELRNYQSEAVAFCRSRHGSLLLHDLGMGKTAMALASADPPLLVVAPATALFGWRQAAESFGMRVQTLQGSSRSGKARELLKGGYDCFLTTYQSAPQWLPHFRKLGTHGSLHTLIADEVHFLHRRSLTWTNAWDGLPSQRRIGLTATPVRNRMPSLWGCLNAVGHGGWGSCTEFLERYAGAARGPYGLQFGDLTNGPELIQRMSEVALRRSLEEPEFDGLRPRLHRETIPITLSTTERSEMFTKARKNAFSQYGRGGFNPTQLRYLNEQRILAGDTKLRWLMAHKQEVRNEIAIHKRTLWWFWHKQIARTFHDWLRSEFSDVPCDLLTGASTPKKRDEILREWEHGSISEPRTLVGSIDALNAAANLLTCRAAYFVELHWAPISMVQAEKRHHRPGSKYDDVYAYNLVIEDSIDEDIALKLLAKVEEAEQLLGKSGTVAQMTALFNISGHEHNILAE